VIYNAGVDAEWRLQIRLTIMKMDDDRFRVVTGGAHGMADKKWFADNLVGDATIEDLTSTWCTVGLWGPRARDILAAITSDDVSKRGVPVQHLAERRNRWSRRARLADLIRRRPRLGALRAGGAGREALDGVWEAGQPHGIVPAASASTAPQAAWRRRIARSASSSTPTTPSSRPTWRGGR